MTKKSTTAGLGLFLIALQLSVVYQNCSNLNGVSGPSGFGTGIQLTAAPLAQCPSGGNIYTVFQDVNNNGLLDPFENIISTQTVCNGLNGLTSLISTNRVTTDYATCASGSGIQINSGADTNSDGLLEPSEITNTQVVCDGSNGAIGAAGPAGSNGHNIVYAVTAASTTTCPDGGSTVLMALDVNNTGEYCALDPNQQSIVLCNGKNAPLSPYLPIQPIMPCGNNVAYKEVLLRLSNGQVLAAFSDNVGGLNTRLTLLPDGSYIDTDDSNCQFSLLTSNDQATRSISWFGKVQISWPFSNN